MASRLVVHHLLKTNVFLMRWSIRSFNIPLPGATHGHLTIACAWGVGEVGKSLQRKTSVISLNMGEFKVNSSLLRANGAIKKRSTQFLAPPPGRGEFLTNQNLQKFKCPEVARGGCWSFELIDVLPQHVAPHVADKEAGERFFPLLSPDPLFCSRRNQPTHCWHTWSTKVPEIHK